MATITVLTPNFLLSQMDVDKFFVKFEKFLKF